MQLISTHFLILFEETAPSYQKSKWKTSLMCEPFTGNSCMTSKHVATGSQSISQLHLKAASFPLLTHFQQAIILSQLETDKNAGV